LVSPASATDLKTAAWIARLTATRAIGGTVQDGGSGVKPRERPISSDDQYPVWPLTAAQGQYAAIDGARMKQHVVALSRISLRYRDAGHKWWGACQGRGRIAREWRT
jgi:hypothetical protein